MEKMSGRFSVLLILLILLVACSSGTLLTDRTEDSDSVVSVKTGLTPGGGALNIQFINSHSQYVWLPGDYNDWNLSSRYYLYGGALDITIDGVVNTANIQNGTNQNEFEIAILWAENWSSKWNVSGWTLNNCTIGPDLNIQVVALDRESIEIIIDDSAKSVTATVLPAPDIMPPVVNLTSPADGDKVGGLVTITANASDDEDLERVDFYNGTTLLASDTTAPFSTEINFCNEMYGQNYSLRVVAYDVSGNSMESSVTVNKPDHDFRQLGPTLADNGCFFKVWAPHPGSANICGDFVGWTPNENNTMDRYGDYYFIFVPNAVKGQKYQYVFNGSTWKPDPYARMMEHDGGASIIIDTDEFAWTDQEFNPPKFEEMVIYELHLGTYIGKGDGQTWAGNFTKLKGKIDYLLDLGINTIELLPVNEVPGPYNGSNPYLGYAPISYFAIETAYGTQIGSAYNELKDLVNYCHSRNMAIIADVVYNHVGSKGSTGFLYNYDGDTEFEDGGIYFNGNEHYSWGWMPDWNRNEVSDYIRDSAYYFVEELHFDGLRYDATTAIHDNGGADELQSIVWDLKQDYPKKIQICENLPYNDWMVRNGNMDSGWYGAYHHKMQEVLKGQSGNSMGDLETALNGGNYDEVFSRVLYGTSHDECWWDQNPSHSKKYYNVDEFASSWGYNGRNEEWALRKTRVMSSLIFFTPGIPMIFQGEEICQDYLFTDNWSGSMNWSLEHSGPGDQFKDMYKSAIWLKKNNSALQYGGLNITSRDYNNNILCYKRESGGDIFLVIVNLRGDRWFSNNSYGVPTGGANGQWTQVFCTENTQFGGSGGDNYGNEPWTQGDGKIYVNIPKMSVTVFQRK